MAAEVVGELRSMLRELDPDKRRQLARMTAQPLALVVFGVAVETWVVSYFGLGLVASIALGALVYSPVLVILLLMFQLRFAGWFPVRSSLRWVPWLVVLWVTTHNLLVGYADVGMEISDRTALLIAALAVVPSYVLGRKVVRIILTDMVTSVMRLRSAGDAEAMIEICRRRREDPKLPPDDAVVVEMNLAHALVARSSLRGRPDGLLEALDRLGAVVREPAPGVDPEAVFVAALELLDVVENLLERHGDARYQIKAIQIWVAAGRRVYMGDERRALELTGAVMAEAHHEDVADDPAAAAWHRAAAVDQARAALALAPPGSILVGYLEGILPGLLVAGGSIAEADEAVALVRSAHARAVEALERVPRRRRFARGEASAEATESRAMLAGALLARAANEGASDGQVDADTREAMGLCASMLDDPDVAGSIGSAHRMRFERGLSELREVEGTALPGPSAAYRRYFAAAWQGSDVDGRKAAMAWANWAITADHVDDAAESLWQLVATLPAGSVRQLTLEARRQFAGTIRSLAQEAGYWLARSGRLEDAVVAVEHCRALLLTGPDPEDGQALRDALRRAGRPELWHRWEQAATRRREVDRAQYLATAVPAGFVSEEARAWHELDEVSRLIEGVTGQVPGRLVEPYARLRERIGDRIVVYVGAAEREGFALVVGGDRPEPVWVRLPALTSDAVEERALRCLAARNGEGGWPQVLADVLVWLGRVFSEPLLGHLPLDQELTLVPVGPLVLLPLHAAPLPGGNLSSDPAFVVHYAPNVRLAAEAWSRAARLARSAPRVLVAHAAGTAGEEGFLRCAVAEAEGVAQGYVDGGTTVWMLPDAGVSDVVEAMASATVWHLACHGHGEIQDALASAVVLVDGELTVRDILASETGLQRLAVLAACDADAPDVDLMNEVVTFPGALLRAGVAGVVAPQWAIHDQSAAVTMLRFHEELRRGGSPAFALRAAQRWVRTATRAELHAAHPEIVRTAEPPDERPFRSPVHWAAFGLTGA